VTLSDSYTPKFSTPSTEHLKAQRHGPLSSRVVVQHTYRNGTIGQRRDLHDIRRKFQRYVCPSYSFQRYTAIPRTPRRGVDANPWSCKSLNPSSYTQRLTYHQLNDKADLLHLLLASKRMQALATRLLYEHFDLVLASEMEESLSRVLSTRNTGRDFMRGLTLCLDVDHDGDPKGAYRFVGMLLENLPLNKLLHFR
jgi:hypothetical protein